MFLDPQWSRKKMKRVDKDRTSEVKRQMKLSSSPSWGSCSVKNMQGAQGLESKALNRSLSFLFLCFLIHKLNSRNFLQQCLSGWIWCYHTSYSQRQTSSFIRMPQTCHSKVSISQDIIVEHESLQKGKSNPAVQGRRGSEGRGMNTACLSVDLCPVEELHR